MKIEEALGIINSVCVQFRGTLQEHQTIQKALEVITLKVKEQGEPAPGTEHIGSDH